MTSIIDFPPLRHHPLSHSKQPSILGNPHAHRSGNPIGGGIGRRGGFRGRDRWTRGMSLSMVLDHTGDDLCEKFELANKTSNNVVVKKNHVNDEDACGEIPAVEASGENVTKPVEEISVLGLGLHDNIKNVGPILMAGRDLMASSKTAAFCFPIIARLLTRRPTVAVLYARRFCASPLALIMFPTRALSSQIHDGAKRCNYANPTPIQRHAIPTLMAGRDLMTCAQTGSGKTAAFCFSIKRPAIGAGGFRGHSQPACPLPLIMSPTRELPSQVAKSKLPFFGSRVQYRSLYNSCSTAYWKSSGSFDDQGFYNDHIRSHMITCYRRMNFTLEQHHPRVIRFISVADFVSLVLRYPSGFEASFWGEVVDNWIVVEDTDETTYPPWFLQLGLKRLILKQAVEILCPPLPAPEVNIFYCDGSPSTIKDLPGGGGVLRVQYTGNKDTGGVKISAFAVVVQYADSFETEARVLLAAANYAKWKRLERCVFYSDNRDLIEGLNGRRLVRVGCQKLISQIIDATSHLKERWFVYTPREGVAACDEIAWKVRVGQRDRARRNAHKRRRWPGQMKELVFDVVEKGLAMENYGKLISNVPPTSNLIRQLNKACFRTPVLRFEFLNSDEATLPSEVIEKKKRFCPEKEYGC